jgi:hypothetical protein
MKLAAIARKRYFATHVDRRSRRSMLDFLSAHARYFEQGAGVRFAHNVRLPRLCIPRELDDRVWQLSEGDFWPFLTPILDEFAAGHPGFLISSAGRSNGWLILWRKGGDLEVDAQTSLDELRWLTRIVCDFDDTVDAVRWRLFQVAARAHVKAVVRRVPRRFVHIAARGFGAVSVSSILPTCVSRNIPTP